MNKTRTASRVPLVVLLTVASGLAAHVLEAQDTRSPSAPPRVLNRGAIDQAVRVCVRQVPNLTQGTIDNARAILARYDLALGDVRTQESPAPKGTILNQTVSPGTQVKCGTPVSVVVSSGPRMTATGSLPKRGDLPASTRRGDDVVRAGTSDGVPGQSRPGTERFDPRLPDGGVVVAGCRVPPLVGRQIDEVRFPSGSLRSAKLQWSIGRVEQVLSEAATGTILKQSPSGGYMTCGGTIDVWIAARVEVQTCRVPNLIGQRYNASMSDVDSRGPRGIGRVERVESNQPEGTILKQSPAAGEYRKCPPVDLWIAAAPQTCTVPDLINRQIDYVQPRLRQPWSIGRIERAESRAAEGTILKQSPAPGVYPKCDTSIDVLIAVPVPTPPPPPTTCTVPDVTNQQITFAQARLPRPFVIGRVEQAQSRAPEGTILKQSPAPGIYRTCAPQIDVLIAVPPPVIPAAPCVVPEVRGTDINVAQRSLSAASLQVGTVESGAFDRPKGTVMEQSLTAGTQVRCGTPVNLQVSTGPALVRVPSLQGQDAATARRTLEGTGLALGTIDRRPSEQTAGAVIEQLPIAGAEVQRGTPVQVWLSAGPTLLPVPDLRGRDRGAAADTLAASRFRLGDVAERPVEAPPGTIVDQQPAAGTLARPDTPVRVWVAVPVPIEVPSLIGRRESEAAGILSGRRLRVGTIQTREASEPQGTIIEQRPQARQQVKPNTTVDLIIAKPILVPVPDLRGRDRRGASVLLTNARLQLGESAERESESPAGTVVEQSPRAGETVEIGAPVQIWTAVPVRVEVPSLVGHARADALNLLGSSRLRIGTVATRESSAAQGAVVEQRPPAGERVEVGSAVDLILAIPVTVIVPDLRDSTTDQSSSFLRTRGLVIGTVTERPGTGVPGRVIDQQPAAGARVPAGTAIAVSITAEPAAGPITPQGSQQLEVPDLRGRTREEAQAILAARGLVLGQASTAPSSEAPDTVISQQPTGASRVPPGTGVNVVLAVAPVQPAPAQLRPVPNVIGMTVAQAAETLRVAGYAAGSTSNVPSSSPAGTVTAQMPVAGASAQSGAAIALVIAVPIETGSSVPLPLLWTLLGIGLGAATAATAAWARGKTPPPPPPSVTLVPHPDPAMAVTLSADGPFTRSELMLRPFADAAGVQTVQGSGPFGMIEVTEAR